MDQPCKYDLKLEQNFQTIWKPRRVGMLAKEGGGKFWSVWIQKNTTFQACMLYFTVGICKPNWVLWISVNSAFQVWKWLRISHRFAGHKSSQVIGSIIHSLIVTLAMPFPVLMSQWWSAQLHICLKLFRASTKTEKPRLGTQSFKLVLAVKGVSKMFFCLWWTDDGTGTEAPQEPGVSGCRSHGGCY